MEGEGAASVNFNLRKGAFGMVFLLFYFIFKELFGLMFLGLKIGWFFIRNLWPAMALWLVYMFVMADVYISGHRMEELDKKVSAHYMGMVFLYCVLAQLAFLGLRKLNRKFHISAKGMKRIKRVF